MSRQKPKRKPNPRGLQVLKNRIVCCQHEIIDPVTLDRLEATDGEDDGCVILFGRGNVDPAYEALIHGCYANDYREKVVTYLPPDPEAEWEVDRAKFPKEGQTGAPIQGNVLHFEDDTGPVFARVLYCDPFTLKLSTNDPYAGRTVLLKIRVTKVRAAYPEELITGFPLAYSIGLDSG